MENKLRHLESLARLAKGADSEGRQKLLREVTDLFMETPEGLSQTEIDYFGDIMQRLAFELEMKLRKHLAETLAAAERLHGPLPNMMQAPVRGSYTVTTLKRESSESASGEMP